MEKAMIKAHRVIIEQANDVKAQCFKAATELTEHARKEAKRMEDRFADKYGESYDKYASLTYEQWSNGRVR